MKVSYNWLKQYIDFNYTPLELKNILTMLGLEVGKYEEVGGIPGNLEGIVVGHVLSAEQHPNADKLKVTQVDVGQEDPLHIVCGAPNVAAGQKVPVATIGTMLYPFGKSEEEGFKIKKGKIRGEVSMGMICAEDEMGLGASHDGIMVLEDSLKPGTPFREVVELDQDFVLEIDLTPNRVDGSHHYGVARDVAAYMRTQARLPELKVDKAHPTKKNPIPVTIGDADRCKRYVSIYIEGVEVKESPDWLKQRLQSIGLRPINNVVDITNFVLHELGQPLHAFDAAQIAGSQIIVDTLPEKQKFTTLDDIERDLLPGVDLMINDGAKPLCIAGTMGGLNSGVTFETKNVFLESAYFDPGTVRKTAKRLGINSDSSFRFERGVDPAMTRIAAIRAADLIMELAGGEASEIVDQQVAEFPHFEVELSIKKTQRLIGKQVTREEIIEILQALEIEVAGEGDLLSLKVPPYRVDVQRDVDVIEDILRVYGYNNVEIPTKLNANLSFDQYRDVYSLKETYANYLSANGFYEILNNSLVSASYGDDKAVPIVNPLSEELGIMRQSMLPGALEVVLYNQNRQIEGLAVYEFGKTYKLAGNGYDEKEWLALTVSGVKHPMHYTSKAPKAAMTTLTREVERLQSWMGFTGKMRECEEEMFDYGMEMVVNGKILLKYGKVSTERGQKFGLRNEVFHLLIDWQQLVDIYFNNKVSFQSIPQFPSVRRDVSMLINKGISFAEMQQLVGRANPKLIREVALHDVYMGKGIDPDKKSYLISIELRDDNKTLVDKAVDKIMQRVTSLLEKELGAEMRK
ncbi:MAG: phenylalanine--tRNA ligase subunit beta [Bacteroidota bacterium]